jgi:hypothetical protein
MRRITDSEKALARWLVCGIGLFYVNFVSILPAGLGVNVGQTSQADT